MSESNNKRSLRCSFCGKQEREVHRMIQGPGGVRICDECVNLCRDILQDGYDMKAEKPADIKMDGSSVVSGFGYGLYAMHPGESASFVFGYDLGYGSSGGKDTNLVPPYAALRFDVQMVPEP